MNPVLLRAGVGVTHGSAGRCPSPAARRATAVALSGSRKAYGTTSGPRRRRPRASPRARSSSSSGPAARARRRCCAASSASWRSTGGGSRSTASAIVDRGPGDDARWHRRAAEAIRRRKLGMVFQSFNLFPHRTALENVIEAPVYVRQRPARRGDRGRASDCSTGRPRSTAATTTRRSCRAASSSASPSPARSR